MPKVIYEDELPPLPEPDEKGRVPAIRFSRAVIARNIIEARKAAGLSRQDLAKLAGIRLETVSRIESGLHSPPVRAVDKIDRVLKRASAKQQRKAN